MESAIAKLLAILLALLLTTIKKPKPRNLQSTSEFLSDFASGRYYPLSERADRPTIAA